MTTRWPLLALTGGRFARAEGLNALESSSQNSDHGDFPSQGYLSAADSATHLFRCNTRRPSLSNSPHRTTGAIRSVHAGGLFATAMAARRSSYVAAVGSNSGGWVSTQPFDSGFTPALMPVHGRSGADVLGVDFAQTSAAAAAAFKTRGGFVVDCDTGGGHCGGESLAGDVWRFFQDHPYGVAPKPHAGGLPAPFSDRCRVL